MTDKNIETISKEVAKACQADADSASIQRINTAIKEADLAIENLWKALERGRAVDMITERIAKWEKEKTELEAQLAIGMKCLVILTEPQIKAFLKKMQTSNMNDINNRRGLINIFVRETFLKNDRFTMILNGGDKPVEVTDLLLDDIEAAFGENTANAGKSSSLAANAPPYGILLGFGTFYLRITKWPAVFF